MDYDKVYTFPKLNMLHKFLIDEIKINNLIQKITKNKYITIINNNILIVSISEELTLIKIKSNISLKTFQATYRFPTINNDYYNVYTLCNLILKQEYKKSLSKYLDNDKFINICLLFIL
jgi:hypothetical protein